MPLNGESLVFRDFVNVKIKDSVPATYDIYNEWIKGILPDIKLTKNEDKHGVTFSGHSNNGKVYIIGRVFKGKLDTTVFIAQYALKDDGTEKSSSRAKEWEDVMSAIH